MKDGLASHRILKLFADTNTLYALNDEALQTLSLITKYLHLWQAMN